ncbi:MAG: C39 family peptidase [Anaerolineae bacterium]|nr:C39 family peptidase [Anaerolineae bacterium]
MSGRKIAVLFSLILLLVVMVVAAPLALRAVPSRYIAYAAGQLPESLQEPFNRIAVPQQESPILPTAVAMADTSALLGKPAGVLAPAPTMLPTDLPPTFTPPPHTDVPQPPTETPTPVPPTDTPTPVVTLPPPTPTLPPIPASIRLVGFQHQFQEWNNCGPATLAMALSFFGLHQTQSQIAGVTKPNPEDRNVSPAEMAAYVNETTPYQALFRVNGREETIKRLLANGIPVILELGLNPPGDLSWMGWYGHYMLAVAYDDAVAQFWVYDSWLGTGREALSNTDPNGRVLSYADLARDWPHFNRNYIALYRPEQAQLVAEIVGAEMDDTTMWQNALLQAQQDAQSDPQNAFYWFNLGTSLNRAGEYESAAQAFDQARAIGLPWRMLWYQFGPYEAYYEVGRYEDVILLADTTLKDRPYFEESFYYKALAQAGLDRVADARTNLQRAIAFNPNFSPAAEALTQLESGG